MNEETSKNPFVDTPNETIAVSSTHLIPKFAIDVAQSLFSLAQYRHSTSGERHKLNFPKVSFFMMEGYENITPPEKAHPTDSGFDIRSGEECDISPGQVRMVHTGVKVILDHNDMFLMELQVRSRSGMARKNSVFVLNSPGTVDATYTGEVCVILFNAGLETFHINKGDRIAQLVPVFIPRVESVVYDLSTSHGQQTWEQDSPKERGEGGFGSTGVK